MSRLLKYAAAVIFLMAVFIPPVQGAVDWEISGGIQLDATPLAVARAQGSELTYLLTDQAKVLIYSDAGKLAGIIPVDPSVKDIAISAKGEQLYLIDSARKTLKIVDISFIVDFNIDGSPFLGPADARIIVAVFSDFQ